MHLICHERLLCNNDTRHCLVCCQQLVWICSKQPTYTRNFDVYILHQHIVINIVFGLPIVVYPSILLCFIST